ncbi:MAG: serine acetyltransferase, partial [Thermostichales cyanobacterium BF3_bins_165]
MLTAPPPHPTEPVPPPPQPERVSLWQLLREDVACVFERDPAARTVWEVVLTYPGVHAVWI